MQIFFLFMLKYFFYLCRYFLSFMNNTEYLLRLYIPYRDMGYGDYIINKLLYHSDSSKVMCMNCKHIYIPVYNCKTSYINDLYRVECKGCKNIYEKRISQDIFLMEDVFDIFSI
jgi:ribosomal protein S27E